MSRQDWWYIWRVVLDFAKHNKKTMFALLTTIVLGAVVPFIPIVLMGLLLEGVQSKKEAAELVRLSLCMFGGHFLLQALNCRTREWYNQKLEYMKEVEAYRLNEKSLSMDYEYLEDIQIQELRVRGVSKAYLGVLGQVLHFLERMATACISIVIAIGILFPMLVYKQQNEYGWIGSVFASIALFLIMGGLVWLSYKRGLYYTEQEVNTYNGISSEWNRMKYYLDMLAGVESQKDLRNYEQQNMIEEDVEKLCKNLRSGAKKAKGNLNKRLWIGQTTSDLSGLLVYLFTGLRAYVGMISIGQVVMYASSIIQFSESVSEFAETMGWLKETALICKDYVDYLDLEQKKYQGTIPVEKRQDHRFMVEFEHVSFRYPGMQTNVIQDLNLKFIIGEKMAIVGKNGSGKTTFIKLLCRLYDVTEGCIKVNGIDIRKYNYMEYQRLFAVVFQDFQMFAFSVEENIAASEKTERERVLDALKKAGLLERIEKLSNGVESFIGKEVNPEGITFSGGEKQKMAIARAIYKDAPFLIMDEPTAALDPLSECEVYQKFEQMVGKKTALYISHRLASCRFCEDILVFDQGKVVQRGSHLELVKEEGVYQKLWKAQAQYYQE